MKDQPKVEKFCAFIDKATQKRCGGLVSDYGLCSQHVFIATRPIASAGKLGFNLIVRNEEDALEECLKSIAPICDELIITDTGSEDTTIEIACRYADYVFAHGWNDSFSEARNFGLPFSKCSYTMWIDADERLLDKSQKVLQEFKDLDGKGCGAGFVPLNSVLSGSRISRHFLPKIFKTGTAHFESIVHNQLIHQEPLAFLNCPVYHIGYALEKDKMQKKRARTIRLLEMQLKDDPENVFAVMNLARTHMTAGQYRKSMEWVKKGLELKTAVGAMRQMLLYNFAMCHVNWYDYEPVFDAVWECLSINPDNLDMIFILGWVSTIMERWAQGIVYFERYLKLRADQEEEGGFNLLITDFWDAYPQVFHHLAICYRQLKHSVKAEATDRESLLKNPYETQTWKNLSSDRMVLNDQEGLMSALMGGAYHGVADPYMLDTIGDRLRHAA